MMLYALVGDKSIYFLRPSAKLVYLFLLTSGGPGEQRTSPPSQLVMFALADN